MKSFFSMRLVVMFIAILILGSLAYNLGGRLGERKPVAQVETKAPVVTTDTQIIFEQEYRKCRHVVISKFPNEKDIIGKDIKTIRQEYPPANGYRISWQQDTLTIHQMVDDWCPEDKAHFRLKEYRGMVAVYSGPPGEDVLSRVTRIPMKVLPEQVQKAIRNGEYEFTDQEVLNDALENLDEYL